MTSIGGPGGIGGPKGPSGPKEIGGVDDVGDTADVGDVTDVADANAASSATAADRVGASELDALASDLATGKLAPHEAIDRLVAQAGAGLPASQQAELREMISDLVANDPYLSSLASRVG